MESKISTRWPFCTIYLPGFEATLHDGTNEQWQRFWETWGKLFRHRWRIKYRPGRSLLHSRPAYNARPGGDKLDFPAPPGLEHVIGPHGCNPERLKISPARIANVA